MKGQVFLGRKDAPIAVAGDAISALPANTLKSLFAVWQCD